MRQKILFSMITFMIVFSLASFNNVKVEANIHSQNEIFQFLKDAHQKQNDQHSKTFNNKTEIQDLLSSHFTKEYSSFFIEEMFWETDGKWSVKPTDFPIGYIPNFSYDHNTKIEQKNNKIIVSEFFPANHDGPVTWDAHTQTVTIADNNEDLIIININNYIDGRSTVKVDTDDKLLIGDQLSNIESDKTTVLIQSAFQSLFMINKWDTRLFGLTIKQDNDILNLFAH